jgi:hypothetical protein
VKAERKKLMSGLVAEVLPENIVLPSQTVEFASGDRGGQATTKLHYTTDEYGWRADQGRLEVGQFKLDGSSGA